MISILKPDVSSIKFYRHGDEIALVLEGENLWFCYNIRITSTDGSSTRTIKSTLEANATCHSINFHYTPSDDKDLLIQRGKSVTVDVVLYSHFANPINKKNIPAKCMVSYTFKQYCSSYNFTRVLILHYYNNAST